MAWPFDTDSSFENAPNQYSNGAPAVPDYTSGNADQPLGPSDPSIGVVSQSQYNDFLAKHSKAGIKAVESVEPKSAGLLDATGDARPIIVTTFNDGSVLAVRQPGSGQPLTVVKAAETAAEWQTASTPATQKSITQVDPNTGATRTIPNPNYDPATEARAKEDQDIQRRAAEDAHETRSR